MAPSTVEAGPPQAGGARRKGSLPDYERVSVGPFAVGDLPGPLRPGGFERRSHDFGTVRDPRMRCTFGRWIMGRTAWIVFGLVLLAMSAGALFLEGIGYVTQETVLDVGPLEVTAEEEQRVPVPLWISAILGIGGLLALTLGLRKAT